MKGNYYSYSITYISAIDDEEVKRHGVVFAESYRDAAHKVLDGYCGESNSDDIVIDISLTFAEDGFILEFEGNNWIKEN